jgi:Kdo2-lipid IVA lauroyltransferase/acyltransferase
MPPLQTQSNPATAPLWARAFALLPLAWCQRLGGWLGWAVYLSSVSYRRKFQLHWSQGLAWSEAQGGGKWPASAKHQAIAHAGQMTLEALWIWCRPHSDLMAKIVCDDVAVFDTAEKRGNGIIFLAPHLGTFEICPRYYATRGKVTVLFKPSKFPLMNRLLEVARNLPGMAMAPADLSGVRKLFKALKHGGAVGLLPDQVPGEGQGLWIDFFGRPAYTMALPQKLQQLTKAIVVMVFCERLSIGQGWRYHAQIFEGEPSPEAVNQAMQALIARYPGQYLWGYNRYKPPKKTPIAAISKPLVIPAPSADQEASQ